MRRLAYWEGPGCTYHQEIKILESLTDVDVGVVVSYFHQFANPLHVDESLTFWYCSLEDQGTTIPELGSDLKISKNKDDPHEGDE